MTDDGSVRPSSVELMPGKNGGSLLRGGGRHPDNKRKEVLQLLKNGSREVAVVLIAKAIKGDAKAIELVLAYGIGKPTDKLELSGPNGGPIEIMAGMEDHERRALRDAIEAHLAVPVG